MESKLLGAPAPAEGLSCSFFATAQDNQPKIWRGTWESLVHAFDRDRIPGQHPANADPKKYLPAISAACYGAGTLRGRANVLGLQLAIMDVDNAEEVLDPAGAVHPSGRPLMVKRQVGAPVTLDDACDELARLGIAAFAWTTWSSTEDWMRFRLVIPQAKPIDPEVWGQASEWVMGVTGLNKWRSSLDLPVLRDTARIHFLPARRLGGPPVHRREVKGEILMPPSTEELARLAPPKPILQPWQKELMTMREAQGYTGSKSKTCSWVRRFKGSDGRPLDLATLDGVRLLEALRCRVSAGRAWGGGTKHRTTCPWFAEHSHAHDDDSGVLFLEPGRWPAWHCAHSHHAHLGLVDLLEAAGVLR